MLEKIKQEEIDGFNTESRGKRRSTRRGIEFNISMKRPSDLNVPRVSEPGTHLPSIDKREAQETVKDLTKKLSQSTNNMIPKSPTKRSKINSNSREASNTLDNFENSSNSLGAIKLINKSVSLLNSSS